MPRGRPSRSPRAGAIWRSAWFVVAVLGVGAGVWWTAQPPQAGPRLAGEPAAVRPRAGPPSPAGLSPTPVPTVRPRLPAARPATPVGLAAVIFDDAGATLSQIEPILALGRPVTIAVLPGLPASRGVAERAVRAGLEVLLHLPMEAEETGRALGPGGVTSAMTAEEIAATVRRGLADVPGALGVNSHMGSRATADRRVMAAVLAVVREHGLVFVDSRTTVHTVGLAVARDLGVPALERTVFLDNQDDPAYIAAQIRQLLEAARTRGAAIGIGHAQKMTAEVLRDLLPDFDRAGVALVPISALFRGR